LSTSQLYRKIKSVLHTSTNNLILEYRMDKALEFLRRKNKTISEIAFETGFNSAAYFTKCFHKKYGFSPSSFIKNA
jgi:AraC-like DNA-binding protein